MKILIEHGKHGKEYYDASTKDALEASSFHILKNRFSSGYYYESWDKPDDSNVLSESQIKNLPTEKLKLDESAKRESYLKEMDDWFIMNQL